MYRGNNGEVDVMDYLLCLPLYMQAKIHVTVLKCYLILVVLGVNFCILRKMESEK